MKKLYVLLGAMVVFYIFSGCSKKDSGPAYYMSAKSGDIDYYVANCIVFSSAGTTIVDGFVQTSATPTYPYITLSLQKPLGFTGEIKLDNISGSYAEYHTITTFASISKSGTVIITNATGSIVSGTFSFTCADGTTITDGVFVAKRL
jgi:hypothetical protein